MSEGLILAIAVTVMITAFVVMIFFVFKEDAEEKRELEERLDRIEEDIKALQQVSVVYHD
jgi:biopolymer transport protein ExbB/TolQ